MSAVEARITRLKKALAEVLAQRQHFSDDTIREIFRALNDKISTLEAPLTDLAATLPVGDQIRLVSVMFVDVENSTRLAQILGEDWKPLLDEMHSRVARIVDDWRGEVGQYLGDGLLCFFGAHHSRGDDAARTVGCALAIQAMALAFARDIELHYGEEVALRVGISTGRVVVGVIGTAAKREVAAVGSTTNLASRLQHLCPPRHVLIDADTYYQVRERFVVQTQTPVKLKGFDIPLNFYLVVGPRQPGGLATDNLAGIPLPFLGRAVEIAHLTRLWQDALAEGALHAISIYGDVGVGKSRLLQETLAGLQASDARPYVVTLTAEDDQRTGTYALLRQLLAELCRQADGETVLTPARIGACLRKTWPGSDADAATTVISRLLGIVSDEGEVIPLDPLETAVRWLLSLAGDRPLLLVVDNLELADHTSLDLLEYLALVGVGHPGLVLAAGRADLRDRRPQFMASSARLTEMTLGGLDAGAARTLVEAVVRHVDDCPPGLVERVCALSEGNPLFIEEFLRMLFDTRVFVPVGSGHWRANNFLYRTLEVVAPPGLLGIFQARLDDLPPLAQRVIQAAAVVGPAFWEGAVSHLTGYPTQPVLDELVAHGLLTMENTHGPNGQPDYRFRHALYRDVAYSMLTRPDREAYHRRAAEWLERWTDHYRELLPLRAEHLVEGQRREQALAVYLTAAVDRIQRGQFQEALKRIESGLASARDVPRLTALPLVSQMWMWQAYVLLALRRYGEASAAAHSALMLMGELPDDALPAERVRAAAALDAAQRHLEPPAVAPGR